MRPPATNVSPSTTRSNFRETWFGLSLITPLNEEHNSDSFSQGELISFASTESGKIRKQRMRRKFFSDMLYRQSPQAFVSIEWYWQSYSRESFPADFRFHDMFQHAPSP